MKLYTVGKGPSAMTVEASPKVAAKLRQTLIIKGTVTDIAAGTKQTNK